jgi:stalled ribosome alternative rescue factor ArfA
LLLNVITDNGINGLMWSNLFRKMKKVNIV